MKKHFLSMLLLWVCLLGGAIPAGAWKDIKIDLTNGNLLTSDEITNKTMVKFGVAIADDGTATRVEADDASAAIVLNGKFHSTQHGWGNFSATVAVDGPVKISMGTCNWGGDVKVTNASGTQVATFNTNTGAGCYSTSNPTVASTIYKGDATTLTISGGAYTPYIAVEKANAADLKTDYKVTFSLGSVTAEGFLPAEETVEDGSSLTIPANHSLYIEGKTLTGWTDGTNTYKAGDKMTVTANTTLTPVFKDNTKTLADRTSSVTLLWDFQRQNGAPYVAFEKNTGIFVTQATIGGETIDVKLDIDATSGKVNNYGWTDWCQWNGGTKFIIPSCKDAVVTIKGMNDFGAAGKTATTVDGSSEYTVGNPLVYTVTSESETIDIVIGNDGGYYRTIQTVLPVVKQGTAEGEKTAASVVFPLNGNITDANETTPANGFKNTEIKYGSNLAEAGKKGYDNVNYMAFTPSASGSFDNDENAVVFKVTPNEKKFTPTKVSGLIRRFGTDGGLMSVRIKNEEGKTATLGKDLIPARNKALEDDAKKDEPNFRTAFEYDIPSGFETEKGFSLIINIYNNTGRQFGLNNIKIEGTLASDAPATKHSVTLKASPAEGGTVSVEPEGTEFDEGTKLTIKANSNAGYGFVNWTDGDNNVVSTDREASITLNKDMILTANFKKVSVISGKQFTWYVSDGTTTSLSDGTDYTSIRVSESNPSFAIKGKGRGVGGDSRFKASEGADNMWALVVPANAIVEKVEFTNCSENYYQNPNTDSNVTTTFNVASEGATVTTTDANGNVLQYLSKGQLITSTIANHQAGTPITFYADGGQQLAFSTINIYYSITDNGSLKLMKQSVNDGATVERNGNIVLTFDNDVTLAKGASVKVNGTDVRTVVSGSNIKAYYWGLAYNSENTVTLAANSVADGFGNKYDKEISFKVNVGSKKAVEMKEYDYVVSNAEELDAAIAELATTNKAATAERKTVFLKNGNYTYGTLEGNYQHNVSLDKIYNVSLIGESKDGVLISGTTAGITSSTLHLGDNGTGKYLQDLTVRNNLEFRTNNYKAVNVALTGGNKAILKNVALQASQDTYVTGKRTYLEDCDIYGTVDFICGGGDIFFEKCNLILGNRGGDVIVAPNTDAATQWGYVLNNCTVKADEGATLVTDKSWNLGRPWQNEPRAYYLNTKMEVLCSDAGWADMSNLPTHFYEYNSVDKNGKKIDLSTRKNSPSSTNTYTPVLTDAEAAEFTAHNVIGGNDAWDAAAYTQQTAAPAQLTANAAKLTWQKVDDALLYAIFKDGKYVANTTACEYTATEEGTYTVRAANEMGGLGAASDAVEVSLKVTAKLSAGGMGTFCAAQTVKTSAGLTAYTAKVSENTVTLTKVADGIIPAGNGVVLSGEANATYDMELTTAGKTTLEGNELVGTVERTLIENDYSFVLVYDQTQEVSYFKNFQNGAYIPAGKAYLPIPTATQDAKFHVVIGGATGINAIENNGNANEAYYTLGGQKTLAPQKGVYIRGGKKVVIK